MRPILCNFNAFHFRLMLQGWQQKLDPSYDSLQALQALLFKVDLVDSLTYTIEGVMAP